LCAKIGKKINSCDMCFLFTEKNIFLHDPWLLNLYILFLSRFAA